MGQKISAKVWDSSSNPSAPRQPVSVCNNPSIPLAPEPTSPCAALQSADQNMALVTRGDVVLVVDMLKPSPDAYHLGPIVTAYTAVSLLLAALGVWVWTHRIPLGATAYLFAILTILVPVLASEPARRRDKSNHFGLANCVTMVRSLLAAVVGCLIGSPPSADIAIAATLISMVALLMDGLDGFVARKTDTCTEYGAQLDMEVDAWFMLVLSVLVYQWTNAGVWVLFCGLVRYAWVAVQLWVPWFNRPLPSEPALRRKTACVLGVGGLALALYPWPWPSFNTGLAGVATLALAVSFAIDANWLIQQKSEPI